jgi:hypothetical protein
MAIHRRARGSAPSTYGAKQPPTHCLNIGASAIEVAFLGPPLPAGGPELLAAVFLA